MPKAMYTELFDNLWVKLLPVHVLFALHGNRKRNMTYVWSAKMAYISQTLYTQKFLETL
jgi:hypothetical protein